MDSGLLSWFSEEKPLSGLRKSYLKLSFGTVQQLMDVKRGLLLKEINKAKPDAG